MALPVGRRGGSLAGNVQCALADHTRVRTPDTFPVPVVQRTWTVLTASTNARKLITLQRCDPDLEGHVRACRYVAQARPSTDAEAPAWEDTLLSMAARLAQQMATSDTDSHQGHMALGEAAYFGLGVPLDRSVAAAHYEAAVEALGQAPRRSLLPAIAHKQALFNLGFMHQHGLGVKQDLNAAKRCGPDATTSSVRVRFGGDARWYRHCQWQCHSRS